MFDIRERARRRGAEARREAGLNLLVPVDIWKVLQASEISILKKPLKSNISGMFLKKGFVKLVLINTSRTVGHQNFTGCHEYFHLLYDQDDKKICRAGEFDSNDSNEREADYFAAYFLAPDEALEFQVERRLKGKRRALNIADAIALEQMFGMSHQAMLIRLKEAGYIHAEEEEHMRSRVLTQALQLGYSPDLYLPSNENAIISNYAEKAKEALDKGLISQGRYEELLLEAGLEELVFGLTEREEERDETIPL
ncbi:MAG: ImmA/IrrE family metallo-endopeptidase [Armatimonadetes bacterium]|nr:ImmA/IrrE family metallo-endopeptidase [Armatimonadota bacterium]